MKKFLFVFILLLLSITLISCSSLLSKNNETNNTEIISNEEEIEENIEKEREEETIINFEALNKTYTSTKDLTLIDIGDNVYDDQQGIHYTSGEYKEMDFIKDLLYLYLNEDSSIYDYLVSYDENNEKGYRKITEEDKEKLIKNLNSLRSQMELSSGEEMIVRLDRVTFQGASPKTETGLNFKVRVAISRAYATVVPWGYYTITVFEENNKLLAHLF